jgi:hypothetical protein
VAPGGAIPAVAGTVPGLNGTVWRSDVSILNLSSEQTSVTLYLFPDLTKDPVQFEVQTAGPFDIEGNSQLTLPNAVASTFGLPGKKGALSIFSNDGAPLALASRTYTYAPTGGGSFGLGVNGVVAGDTAWIPNVEHDAFFRTNVGVFLPISPPQGQSLGFTVTVFDDDGTQVASRSISFDQAGLIQRNLDYIGVDEALLDGWIEIRCDDPTYLWYGYATLIDEVTGDSVYRPAIGHDPTGP